MSAILSADDLNDFITPGVACIKPVEVQKTNDSGRAQIEIGLDGVAVEILDDGQSKKTLESAQISLTDCLACSGCITSAETVLVAMQSHSEVLKVVRENQQTRDMILVASISHQVRVSLAAAYQLSIAEVDAKLKSLLVDRLNFRYVVGTEIGRHIALEYAAEEVLEKRQVPGSGPILCSSCPGWTCYVEKTHPHMIPYLSHVKSTQQITGSLLKELIHSETGVALDKIYHVSVMPCFDKKLEASRPEFGTESSRDVDCVITAKEIVQLLNDEGLQFDSLELSSVTDEALAPRSWPWQAQWLSHEGSSSGGYLGKALQAIAAGEYAETRVEVVAGKNADMVEYRVVRTSDDTVVGKAAQVYGFRNIQNLVRKLKPSGKRGAVVSRRAATSAQSDPKSYDYVEVMACPGGCINGGGQIGRPQDVGAKEWKESMEQLYNGMEKLEVSRERVSDWVRQMWTNQSADKLVKTDFHAVVAEEPVNAAITIGTKW